MMAPPFHIRNCELCVLLVGKWIWESKSQDNRIKTHFYDYFIWVILCKNVRLNLALCFVTTAFHSSLWNLRIVPKTCKIKCQCWLTFISQDGHCYGEEGTEHIEQCDRHPQCPVIFTLGALCTFLNPCNIQQSFLHWSVYSMQRSSWMFFSILEHTVLFTR